ncbi:LacI family DNA-binding transcriptional regulator [Paraliobacillus sp. JSM ZJ581]|uniref:LacI family DNA-binding transcriptional regulator n=1 Tax=Paraliobacillus sp. JSM ZJ581 TaxID=3342118 RepID=UPI0035A85FEA
MKDNKPSIKKIAELSGYSVATVSRVINNNGRFSEDTRKKILAIIEKTGYQTNSVAKSLRMQKSNTIGILVPDISNYFFAKIVQQIEERLFEDDYSTIICNTARSLEKEKVYLSMLESKMIDGLVVISGLEKFNLHALTNSNIPVICIDRKPTDRNKSIFISSNHYQGAFDATNLLIKKGIKHPVIMVQDRNSSSLQERLRGFKDALKENNITYSKEDNLLMIDSKSNVLSQKTNGIELFTSAFTKLRTCDGIFAINDDLATLAIDGLEKLDIDIPDQVKIIGFDNSPIGQHTSPKLTSVSHNIDEIVSITCDNLRSLIQEPNKVLDKEYIVEVNLALRETT